MKNDARILLTGAAGFIGSYLLGYLNQRGYSNLVISDDFSREDKRPNYTSRKFSKAIHRDELAEFLEKEKFDFVFHLGARTDTTEFDYSVHERLNVEFSKMIWRYCVSQEVPLVYASSAATYGNGERGYEDRDALAFELSPLNPYGRSKNEFDKWALQQEQAPPRWAGLKFFNVFGPNEYHKGRMASMVFHGFRQVKARGYIELFKSHRPDFNHGEQVRDFIYVDDVAAVCTWLMDHAVTPGLYNVGTGRARSFNDLARSVFNAMGTRPDIRFIDMPVDLRDTYQYYTEADMHKLEAAGYNQGFTPLETAIETYVRDYLIPGRYF
jgi:ADP-L-glycero-D-manno-heptose 6-epimerase